MFRKRLRATPHFKIPPPFSPITGEYANLRTDGIMPYCAMMQVAEEDDYEDYVICRGFDPRIQKFIDYEAANVNKPGISVAKPYGSRRTKMYNVGEIYPAFLPIQGTQVFTSPSPIAVDWRLGQNPGVVEDGSGEIGGQPSALSDTVESLVDHNEKVINWMLISSNGGDLIRFKLTEDLVQCGQAEAVSLELHSEDPIDPEDPDGDKWEQCKELDPIVVVDTIGLAELEFKLGELVAPIHSMGFARPYKPPFYEVVSIAIGCCETLDPTCPQIPGVPMEVIPAAVVAPVWLIGYDEDGCLVRVPVAGCPPCEEPA